MSFAQVSRIIGEELPPSAFKHPAWWGSDPKHTQAVWLDVGYLAKPHLSTRQVTEEALDTPAEERERIAADRRTLVGKIERLGAARAILSEIATMDPGQLARLLAAPRAASALTACASTT
jgi:hypothetical protein